MTETHTSALEQCIGRAVERLAPGAGRHAIERGVVLPVLRELGWDVFDTREVVPRFPVGRGSVDLALCDSSASRPHCFVEVHGSRLDPSDGGAALSRARRAQVSLAILTSGVAWRLFVTGADVDAERPVFELDMRGEGRAESAAILGRYLQRELVLSGTSFKVALGGHALAAAWRELASRGDSLLVELLSDGVWDRAGVRPDQQEIREFLRLLTPAQPAGKSSPPVRPSSGRARGTLVICGQPHEYTSVTEALVTLLSHLQRRDPTFLERCAGHARFRGTKKRYIARGLVDLYPESPHLRKHHAALGDGWYLGTNSNSAMKRRQMCAAAEVAGLEFGQDVIADFGETGR